MIGDFLFGNRLKPEQVQVDPGGQALQRFNQMAGPGYGMQTFHALSGSAGGAMDFLKQANALGGSSMMAGEQHQAAQRRRGADAFDAFSRFRMATDSQANQMLGLHLDNKRYAVDTMIQDQWRRDHNRLSFINSILSGGANIAGMAVGSRIG